MTLMMMVVDTIVNGCSVVCYGLRLIVLTLERENEEQVMMMNSAVVVTKTRVQIA